MFVISYNENRYMRIIKMELNKKILKQIRKAINIVLLIMILGMVFVLKNYASNDDTKPKTQKGTSLTYFY